jgi:ketosteroid isomerase-like protein
VRCRPVIGSIAPTVHPMADPESVRREIQRLVDLETEGWNAKDPEPFLSIIHPDLTWPWPPDASSHDPLGWVFVMGRFDRERWRRSWQALFDTHDLVHNVRRTEKIEVTPESDGAFAVVDVDTLWRHKRDGTTSHWKGRACKVYTLKDGRWWFYFQTGLLQYPAGAPDVR